MIELRYDGRKDRQRDINTNRDRFWENEYIYLSQKEIMANYYVTYTDRQFHNT